MPEKTIIILENLDFSWPESTIQEVKKLWKKDVNFQRIAEIVQRRPDETFLLLMHLGNEGQINKRKGYAWGEMK